MREQLGLCGLRLFTGGQIEGETFQAVIGVAQRLIQRIRQLGDIAVLTEHQRENQPVISCSDPAIITDITFKCPVFPADTSGICHS